MDDLFNSVGISLDLKEELNMFFRVGAINSAVPYGIWPDMPSGPDALRVFIPFKNLINSSVVHRMSVPGRSEMSRVGGKAEGGSTPELKFVQEHMIMVPKELFEDGMFQIFGFV